MPSLEENRTRWEQTYDWADGGEEWSQLWGGPADQWWGALFPRLRGFLPTHTVLEIAPGYGRWTQFLLPLCRRLIGVDVSSRCIDACRERFRAARHGEFHVNDGSSLAAVPAGAIDFAFSFDSLVHVEAEPIRAYLAQLATKLKPDGVGFFHHSNLAALRDSATGALVFENEHWRAMSMSAELFAASCHEVGLVCVRQEIVNWGGSELTDGLSTFTRRGSRWEQERRVWENPGFMTEAAGIGERARFYAPLTAGEAVLEHARAALHGEPIGARIRRRLRQLLP